MASFQMLHPSHVEFRKVQYLDPTSSHFIYCLGLMIFKYIFLLILVNTIQPLVDCFEDIKLWMGNSFLKLNENKAKSIIFGSPDINRVLGPLTLHQKPVLKNLGVFFDR